MALPHIRMCFLVDTYAKLFTRKCTRRHHVSLICTIPFRYCLRTKVRWSSPLSSRSESGFSSILSHMYTPNDAKVIWYSSYRTPVSVFFHTVHKPRSLNIKTHSKPVLQGWQDGMGFWQISPEQVQEQPLQSENRRSENNEVAANVYSLPSILQVIKYHHAAAGFPTKDTWVKAIKAGYYVSWPGLTAEAASKHFPEAEEIQKGLIKSNDKMFDPQNKK